MKLSITGYRLALPVLVLTAMAASAAVQAANGYEAGHSALQLWNAEGQAAAPQWVQTWLMIMAGSFALGLLFVWKRVEARWVVGGFVLGLLVSRFAIPALGLVKLSGLVALVHLVFWTPALFLLLKNRPFLQARSLYALWSGWITLVILFSFAFDVRDAVIYGDHMLGLGLFPA